MAGGKFIALNFFGVPLQLVGGIYAVTRGLHHYYSFPAQGGFLLHLLGAGQQLAQMLQITTPPPSSEAKQGMLQGHAPNLAPAQLGAPPSGGPTGSPFAAQTRMMPLGYL